MNTENPPKTPGGAASVPNVMADLLAKSKIAKATPCPNCKSYLPQGGVVCMHCGYNAKTGKAVGTRVVSLRKQKERKPAKK